MRTRSDIHNLVEYVKESEKAGMKVMRLIVIIDIIALVMMAYSTFMVALELGDANPSVFKLFNVPMGFIGWFFIVNVGMIFTVDVWILFALFSSRRQSQLLWAYPMYIVLQAIGIVTELIISFKFGDLFSIGYIYVAFRLVLLLVYMHRHVSLRLHRKYSTRW